MTRALLIIGFALALSGCQTDDPYEPPKPDPDDRAACEAKGGDYKPAGLAANYYCILPTPDAGKACRKSSDCSSGMCLAESRSCPAKGPLFGCYDILEDGEVLTMCID